MKMPSKREPRPSPQRRRELADMLRQVAANFAPFDARKGPAPDAREAETPEARDVAVAYHEQRLAELAKAAPVQPSTPALTAYLAAMREEGAADGDGAERAAL
jgi:hypothetical protein